MIDKHLDTPPGKAGRIRTSTGILVDPWNLDPDDIMVEDIAHSLSHQCRFTGHTCRFYSIAEHCILVASFLKSFGPRIQLAGLIHDAAEAYFGDMAGPSKRRQEMHEYDHAEHVAAETIMFKYVGVLTPDEKAAVKKADADAYYLERRGLIRPGYLEPIEISIPLGLQSIEMVTACYIRAFVRLYQQF